MSVALAHPVPEAVRADAARLYVGAFWSKFRPILGGDPEKAALLFAPWLSLDRGVAAMRGGALLGVIGWCREGRGFFGAPMADFRAAYGWLGGSWRAFALSLFERAERPDELLMDGVCVAESARGQGIGGLLLDAIEHHARALGRARIRLDVVDSNPRARALYERRGYRAQRTDRLGVLRPVFGFSASTEMMKELSP